MDMVSLPFSCLLRQQSHSNRRCNYGFNKTATDQKAKRSGYLPQLSNYVEFNIAQIS